MTDAEMTAWYAGHDSAWTNPTMSNPYPDELGVSRLHLAWTDGRSQGVAKRVEGMTACDAGVRMETPHA